MTDSAPDLIPRTIHYVWVGPQEYSPLIKRCIESWKRYAPDYTLVLWNEENSPMDHPYVHEMYKRKKWAFVSDYIRFWVLSREGGIYLDTDMELLKPLDPLLRHRMFLGRTKDGYTACGIIGAVPHHPLLNAILDFYNTQTRYGVEDTSPKIMTKMLSSFETNDIEIHAPEYFYPCNDGERCDKEALRVAYATHHWAESWVSFASLRKILRRTGIMPLLKQVIGSRP